MKETEKEINMTLKKKYVNVMIKNRFFIILFTLVKGTDFVHAQNYDALCYNSSNDSILIERRGDLLFIESRPAYIEPEWIDLGLERRSLFLFDTLNVSLQNGLLLYSNQVSDIRINTDAVDTIPYGSEIKGLSLLSVSPIWPLICKGKKIVNLKGKDYFCFEIFQDGSVFDDHSKHKTYRIIYVDSTLLIPIKVITIKFEAKVASIENIHDINFFYLDKLEFIK